MKTQKTDKKQISIKNLLICLNTYKNLSNFFINLSKTAKISAKKFGFSKNMLYLCNVKIKKTKTPKKYKIMKTKILNTEISVIVENYTKEQIINALMNFSESYYGAREFLKYEPIEKLAILLIDLANETNFTATDLLDALTIGF